MTETNGMGAGPAPAPSEPALPERESWSSLSTFEICPRRYDYSYVQRIRVEQVPGRFAFGSAVHHAFETFVKARIRARTDGSPEPGPELLRDACHGALAGAGLDDEQEALLRARSLPVLERFIEREATRPTRPVAAELGFGTVLELEDGPVRFVGYLDRVDLADDGSLHVIDYKTGRERTQESVDADGQLTAYAWAAARGALRDPANGATLPPASRLALYFTDGGVEVATTRSEEQLAAFEADLRTMVATVRRREFTPRPSEAACRWCDYADRCPDAARRPAPARTSEVGA